MLARNLKIAVLGRARLKGLRHTALQNVRSNAFIHAMLLPLLQRVHSSWMSRFSEVGESCMAFRTLVATDSE